VLLYAMIVGRPPFETSEVKATYRLIRSGTYAFPPDCTASAEARDLVARLLRRAARARRSRRAQRSRPRGAPRCGRGLPDCARLRLS
jgi:serine/threonine protein kinase